MYKVKAEALAKSILTLVQGGVDDSHCYRNIVDNLYAYRVGAVNGTGKWDTKKLKDHILWTKAAREAKKVQREHAITMADFVRILLKIENPTVEDIYASIDRFCVQCMVTKEEHDILNEKYQSKMPPDFWDENSNFYMDEWIRYKLCSIDVEQ